MYKIAKVKIKGVSPLSLSKMFETERPADLTPGEFDEQHWREHCDVNAAGNVCVSPMAFKKSIDAASKHLGEKVPGTRGQTYTAKFERGLFIQTPIELLPQKKRETLTVEKDSIRLLCSSTGIKTGKGGSVVPRRFPYFHDWAGYLELHIVEPSLLIKSPGKEETDLLFRTIEAAGIFIGVGRFRPQNAGFNGRFAIDGPITLTEVVGKQ